MLDNREENGRQVDRQYLTGSRRIPLPIIGVCCALLVMFLVALAIVLSLIPIYLPSKNVNYIGSDISSFNIAYGTSLVNSKSLDITDLSTLSTNFMQSLNLQGITVSSAQLVPQSSSGTGRKRRATNTRCGTSSCTSGDLFDIVIRMKYPPRCFDSIKCRKTLYEIVQNTISTLQCKLKLIIPIVGGSIDVHLTFRSFGSFQSGTISPIIAFTTATTIDSTTTTAPSSSSIAFETTTDYSTCLTSDEAIIAYNRSARDIDTS